MGIKLPKIKLPSIPNIPDIDFPDVDFPEIPNVGNGSVDIDGKLNKVTGFINQNFPDISNQISDFKSSMPDMNSMIPDMSSMMPEIDTSMATIDTSQFNNLGVSVGSIEDLGIDTQSIKDLGVDTSDLESQLDMSQFNTEIESFDLQSYMSTDMDISSQMEMPDLSPKGIAKLMTGVDDPTDIHGIIESKIKGDGQPKNIKAALKDKANSFVESKIPLFEMVKDVSSYIKDTDLDFTSIDAIKSNDYKGAAKEAITGYTNAKYEQAKPVIDQVKEFASYINTNELDFSSKDAILNNDYLKVGKEALKGYGNAKLDEIENKFDPKTMMSDIGGDIEMPEFDMNSMMSEMSMPNTEQPSFDSMDMSEFESMGIDASQFKMDSINMNFEMPDINTEFDFSNPIESMDMSSIGFDPTQLTKPVRDILNKYL